MAKPPILIACCGNPMAGDDSFGHLVAEALRDDPPAGAEVVDLGMNPGSLLDYVEGRAALVLVDAAHVPGMDCGRLIECDWRSASAPPLASGGAISSHGLSIIDQIKLADRLKLLPAVVKIVAVTMAPSSKTTAPTETMLSQLPIAIECVRQTTKKLADGMG